jgi:hypothetical protein
MISGRKILVNHPNPFVEFIQNSFSVKVLLASCEAGSASERLIKDYIREGSILCNENIVK